MSETAGHVRVVEVSLDSIGGLSGQESIHNCYRPSVKRNPDCIQLMKYARVRFECTVHEPVTRPGKMVGGPGQYTDDNATMYLIVVREEFLWIGSTGVLVRIGIDRGRRLYRKGSPLELPNVAVRGFCAQSFACISTFVWSSVWLRIVAVSTYGFC